MRTLFALSLWEAIFADVPGVFQTPFQRAPLDLCTDAFYQTRREMIDKLLVRVESASRSEERWLEILKPVWDEHFGCAVVGVQWELLTLAEMARVAHGYDGEGDLFLNAYGGVVEQDISGGIKVDTGHVVAWEPTLDYRIIGMGGLKQTLFSGEGLLMHFTGTGKLWTQTRTLRSTAGWITPYLF